jgi:hypothetical protein
MSEANRKYIVDVFEDIMEHVILEYDPIVGVAPNQTGGEKPFYGYGSIKEILQVLSEKDNDKEKKYKKFPLVALVLDLPEKKGTELANEYLVNPRILILEKTDKNYRADQRYLNTMKPTLIPIYDLLLQEMADNPNLNTGLKEQIKHTSTPRVNWGTQTQGDDLNDYLDGIELNFQDLRIFKAEPQLSYITK